MNKKSLLVLIYLVATNAQAMEKNQSTITIIAAASTTLQTTQASNNALRTSSDRTSPASKSRSGPNSPRYSPSPLPLVQEDDKAEQCFK